LKNARKELMDAGWDAMRDGMEGQSEAAFDDDIKREREKCLKTRLEKCQFRVLYTNARQNRSVAGPWKPQRFETGLELRVCETPGVGANPDSGLKMEIPDEMLPML
jgi:hypothetical protein